MNFTQHQLLEILAQSPNATAIYRTGQIIIEYANDAMIAFWDKDRTVIGKPMEEVLPELKEQPFIKILQEIWVTGITYEARNTAAQLMVNGKLQTFYFDFTYMPILEDKKVIAILHTAKDVTEQNLYLEESENRFRFLLNAIPQQVWTALPDGKLDYVNQVVCDDFGSSGDTIAGNGWQEYIHPDDLAGCLHNWNMALESGTEYMVEFRLRFRDGLYRWHLARALPLVEQGTIKLWLGTNTNIDIQKRNEHKKDEFISIASHELKTPLTSIKGFNQLMQRTIDQEKLQTFLKKSGENISNLERLINDLLDVTKLNAGKMNYAMEPFNFRHMMANSIENLQLTVSTHEIILENSPDIIFHGDQFRLEQVMHNFLSNAIKYSPEGGKIIVNGIVERDNIIVSVQDFGIGIAGDKLDKLFDRYYRVDNTDMRFEGLGLGLFISSEILKRHQGSFWIESELHKGATFYFRLPLSRSLMNEPTVITDTYYKDSFITIQFNKAKKCLEVDWTGFQDLASVQRGGRMMLEMMAKNYCSKILNDNRQVKGTWSEAADWARNEWLPEIERAGLRYLAWIYSPSMFSQLSTKKSVDAISNVTTQFFTDAVAAEEWIDQQPA